MRARERPCGTGAKPFFPSPQAGRTYRRVHLVAGLTSTKVEVVRGLGGKPEKNGQRCRNLVHLLVRQSTDASSDLPGGDCRNLVDHNLAVPHQAVVGARHQIGPPHRNIGSQFAGERTDDGGVETRDRIVLNDDSRPRLAVVAMRHDQNDVAPRNYLSSSLSWYSGHSSVGQSLTASIHGMISSPAGSLLPSSFACR